MDNPRDKMYGFNYFDGYEGAYFNPSEINREPLNLQNEHKIVTRSSLPSYFDFMKNKPFSNMMLNEHAPESVLTKRNPYVDQQQLMHMQFQRLLGMQHQQQVDMQRRQQSYMKNLQQLEHQHGLNSNTPAFQTPHTRTIYPQQLKNLDLQNPSMFASPLQQTMSPLNNPFQHPANADAIAETSKRFPPLSPELNNFLHTPLKDLLKVEQMAKVNHESFAPSLLGLFTLINKDKPLTATGHGIE